MFIFIKLYGLKILRNANPKPYSNVEKSEKTIDSVNC